MYKKILLIIPFLILSTNSFSQNDIEVLEPSYIKSVSLHAKKVNSFVPVIRLGEKLHFSFDDLEADEKEYTYKLTHCSANWEVTNMNSTEFIDGFNDNIFRNYENSFNTYQNYTHYELQIPNKNTQIKISGNYIISILNEDEDVVFTRRFIVYQQKVDVGVSIHKARKVKDIDTKQNVEMVINYPNLKINNPSEEIQVAIYKNHDWNSFINNLKPQYYRGTQLIYKYGDETTFFGGNEFLNFDTKDYRSNNNNIRRVQLKDVYETRLYADHSRGLRSYTHYPDINGNFFIRSINVENTKIEGDYTKVHYIYKPLEKISNDKDLYVYGAFNNWQFTNDNKLTLTNNGYYETDILQKQGFYNYTYVTLDKDFNIDNTIEGTHYQTENEYAVFVYYKRFGSKYDEVIGYGVGSSVNLQN